MERVIVVLHHGPPDVLDEISAERLARGRAVAAELGGTIVAMNPLLGGPLGPCRTTRDEAMTAAGYLLPDTPEIVLCTSATHSWRATRIFRRVGFRVTPRPAPWPPFPRAIKELWYEVASTLWNWRNGWL